jgi:hypothetical protein
MDRRFQDCFRAIVAVCDRPEWGAKEVRDVEQIVNTFLADLSKTGGFNEHSKHLFFIVQNCRGQLSYQPLAQKEDIRAYAQQGLDEFEEPSGD